MLPLHSCIDTPQKRQTIVYKITARQNYTFIAMYESLASVEVQTRQILLLICSFIQFLNISAMDQEEGFFYENQRDFFGLNHDHISFNSQLLPLVGSQSICNSEGIAQEADSQIRPPLFKAYNPLDRFKDMPEDKQNQYFFMFKNYKKFGGIQHLFELDDSSKFTGDFLQNIESDALGNNNTNNDFQLDKLFLSQQQNPYKQQIKNSLLALHKRMEEINHRTLGNINLNKTISQPFYEHFENFSMVFNPTSFAQELENNLANMMAHAKKMKGPGMDLIATIYEYWMKSFKDFVNEIWKYSSKYTLNFFKKEERHEQPDSHTFSDIRSESSNTNTMGSKEKRKGWSNEQTQILEQLINSNIIFSQSVLKKLATQFNRSMTSISSKIQKITKSKRGEETQEQSLLIRAMEILKLNPEGLNRDSIIEKINENYEMGYGGQWEKSVGQLLSNRKEFIKIRGKHKLLRPEQFRVVNINEADQSKFTFKDKVIQVFLASPNAQSDLKGLVDTYIALFEEGMHETQALNQQRRKSIEANISKTLSRYDIFDSSKARTLYLLNPLLSKQEGRNMQIEVEQYFDL